MYSSIPAMPVLLFALFPLPQDLGVLLVGLHEVGARGGLGLREADKEKHQPAEYERPEKAQEAPPLKKNGDGHERGKAQTRKNTANDP